MKAEKYIGQTKMKPCTIAVFCLAQNVGYGIGNQLWAAGYTSITPYAMVEKCLPYRNFEANDRFWASVPEAFSIALRFTIYGVCSRARNLLICNLPTFKIQSRPLDERRGIN